MRFTAKTPLTAATPQKAKRAAALALAACLSAFQACGVESSIDREPRIVEDVVVDGIRILPFGSRYVLADSATELQFVKFHPGYACSEILEMDVSDQASGNPPAFGPVTRIRLPGSQDCALESTGRDTVITHVFGAGPDSVRLANSAGKITDSAKLVRGGIAFDSLQGKFSPTTRTFSSGLLTVIDSSGAVPRRLFVDSLPACKFLNQAEDTLKADTSWVVRYSVVTLDSSAAPDTCRGGTHRDSIPVTRVIHPVRPAP